MPWKVEHSFNWTQNYKPKPRWLKPASRNEDVCRHLSKQPPIKLLLVTAYTLTSELTILPVYLYFWAWIPSQLQAQRLYYQPVVAGCLAAVLFESVYAVTVRGCTLPHALRAVVTGTCAVQQTGELIWLQNSSGRWCIFHVSQLPGWLQILLRASAGYDSGTEASDSGDGKERNRAGLLEQALPWREHPSSRFQ